MLAGSVITTVVPGKPEVRGNSTTEWQYAFIGNQGQIETVIEYKLELVCEEPCLKAGIAAPAGASLRGSGLYGDPDRNRAASLNTGWSRRAAIRP